MAAVERFYRLKYLLCVLFVSFHAWAKCADPRFKKYIEMDYKTFDQSPPDGGWRVLKDKGSDLQIAETIDAYVHCRPGLKGEQKATLVFHSGQIYGDLGKKDIAIKRMKQAHNASLDKKYHWNSYVDGSIAFFEHDLEKLKSARDKVQATEADHPYVQTLNDLIRCFKRPYKDFERCRNEKPKAQDTRPVVK